MTLTAELQRMRLRFFVFSRAMGMPSQRMGNAGEEAAGGIRVPSLTDGSRMRQGSPPRVLFPRLPLGGSCRRSD